MDLIFEPSDHARYLSGLEECFPGWGGESMYRWCFERSADAPPPERMVFAGADGAWVAGTAISFRTMRFAGKTWLSGVMTGSWTLPAARGQGLFPRFIQETRKRVAHHGGVAVLGFAGDVQRASTRKLADAGSRCVPSTNMIGEVAALPEDARTLGERLDARIANPGDLEALYTAWKERAKTRGGFVYSDANVFRGQFFDRALPVEIVRDGDAVALIERAADTDRVMFADERGRSRAGFFKALWSRAAAAGRKLYAYGVGASAASVCRETGLAPKDGYFTILPATDSAEDNTACDELASIDWDFQSGDRM